MRGNFNRPIGNVISGGERGHFRGGKRLSLWRHTF